jgi:PAS domain S-box-containing protein
MAAPHDDQSVSSADQHLIDKIINSLPGLFYLFDAQLRARRWNLNTERVLGFSAQELEGKYLGDWHATRDGRDRAVKASLRVLETGGAADAVESELQTRDGPPIPFLLTGIRVDTPDGPMLAGVGIDLTERRRLEEYLRQAQKMESVGRLAGGVAHDFNNILTCILGNLDLAAEQVPALSPVRGYLRNIEHAASSAAMLTRQLLAFSRKDVVAPRIVHLNEQVADLKGLLDRLLGEDIEFRMRPEADLWPIRIDPGQLEQVILNLAVNARDAMPNGGVLTLAMANQHLDEAFFAVHGEGRPGDYLMLALSDTGHGMAPDVLGHIFEPFFTTKPMGRGTGLGLAIVFGAVQQNQGFIDVFSEPGAGSIFRIYLPRTFTEPVEPASDAPCDLNGQGETVLVAEDDPRIRTIVDECLQRLGYRVRVCANGAEALDADLAMGTVELLVTDLIMPDMNGRQLAERIQRRRPCVKVLYTSGYTADILGRHGMLDAGVDFLAKPYTPMELARRVRTSLDRRTD